MSNQIRFKHLLTTKIAAPLFWGSLLVSLFACSPAPALEPTLDTNAIFTAAFETAQVLNAQTQVASNPTVEPTLAGFAPHRDGYATAPTDIHRRLHPRDRWRLHSE
jgi:hypothetical protein